MDFRSEDQYSSIVLSNFSNAIIIGSQDEITGPSKIGWYMAPECYERKVSKKSDIFGLGCLLYAIFSCKPLPKTLDLCKWKIPNAYPDQLQHLIDKCMSIDPASRPDIDAVIATLAECSASVESGELGMDEICRYIDTELGRRDKVDDFFKRRQQFKDPTKEILDENLEKVKQLTLEPGTTLQATTQSSEEIRSPVPEAGVWPGYTAQSRGERRVQARSEARDEPWRSPWRGAGQRRSQG